MIIHHHISIKPLGELLRFTQWWLLNSNQTTPDARGNITCEPDFVYDDEPYGYYHIKYESYYRNHGDGYLVGQNETDMDNENRIQENVVDIGADEVGCTDTYNVNDWTHDGVVNMDEFTMFSAAWLSHDPNDPVCDPNHPNYVSDPNAPGYISESAKEHWNPICDFDQDYDVDVIDFTTFYQDWLWRACWHGNYVSAMNSMSSFCNSEELLMADFADQTLTSREISPFTDDSPVIPALAGIQTPQISVEARILNLQNSIDFLEKLWLEEPNIQKEIKDEDWKAFMDAVYNSLTELQAESVQTK